jgi:predicted nucleic acid-binding protein
MCHLCHAAPARGVSLTTIDTLIAAIALEHGAACLTLDQDFLLNRMDYGV